MSIVGGGKHRLKIYIQSCAISEQTALGLIHSKRKRKISKKNDKRQRIFLHVLLRPLLLGVN